jgi:hypothetical protein
VLEATHVVHVLRPYSMRHATEIVAAPKVYGFDTGFVCYHRGWTSLRDDDLGYLWKHYVLNELHARLQTRRIHYWRDKRRHEVDFVVAPRGAAPVAIECRWSAARFEPAGLLAFRRHHPRGENFVVARDVDRSYKRTFEGREVTFVGLQGLIRALLHEGSAAVREAP